MPSAQRVKTKDPVGCRMTVPVPPQKMTAFVIFQVIFQTKWRKIMNCWLYRSHWPSLWAMQKSFSQCWKPLQNEGRTL